MCWLSTAVGPCACLGADPLHRMPCLARTSPPAEPRKHDDQRNNFRDLALHFPRGRHRPRRPRRLLLRRVRLSVAGSRTVQLRKRARGGDGHRRGDDELPEHARRYLLPRSCCPAACRAPAPAAAGGDSQHTYRASTAVAAAAAAAAAGDCKHTHRHASATAAAGGDRRQRAYHASAAAAAAGHRQRVIIAGTVASEAASSRLLAPADVGPCLAAAGGSSVAAAESRRTARNLLSGTDERSNAGAPRGARCHPPTQPEAASFDSFGWRSLESRKQQARAPRSAPVFCCLLCFCVQLRFARSRFSSGAACCGRLPAVLVH